MFYEAPCVQRWMPLLTVLLIINTSHGEVDSPQSKQHAVTLPNGVVAEVVGVSTGTAKHRAWWAPNGKPLAEAPYEYRARQRVASDPRKYEIVVRVSAPRNVTGESTTSAPRVSV